MNHDKKSSTNNSLVKVGIVGFSDTCIQPLTMMIKGIYTFIAKFAMHGFDSDAFFTDPAIFGLAIQNSISNTISSKIAG